MAFESVRTHFSWRASRGLQNGAAKSVCLYSQIQGETKLYDTLDSLLLNNSPKSMEMVSQALSSRLEGLIAREDSGSKDERNSNVETVIRDEEVREREEKVQG
jgi:hypothetical protein